MNDITELQQFNLRMTRKDDNDNTSCTSLLFFAGISGGRLISNLEAQYTYLMELVGRGYILQPNQPKETSDAT